MSEKAETATLVSAEVLFPLTVKECGDEVREQYDNICWELATCHVIHPRRKQLLKQTKADLEKSLRRAEALYHLGAEKGAPPRNWYAGVLPLSKHVFVSGGYEKKLMWLQHQLNEAGLKVRGGESGSLFYDNVFVGYTPPAVLEKFLKVREITGHDFETIVTSPRQEDFVTVVHTRDPQAFVYLKHIGWLRIATWQFDKDLAGI